jgi:hypothetical protein
MEIRSKLTQAIDLAPLESQVKLINTPSDLDCSIELKFS